MEIATQINWSRLRRYSVRKTCSTTLTSTRLSWMHNMMIFLVASQRRIGTALSTLRTRDSLPTKLLISWINYFDMITRFAYSKITVMLVLMAFVGTTNSKRGYGPPLLCSCPRSRATEPPQCWTSYYYHKLNSPLLTNPADQSRDEC